MSWNRCKVSWRVSGYEAAGLVGEALGPWLWLMTGVR